MSRTPPYRLGVVFPGTPYRLTRVLGYGGMAIVYQGYDVQCERTVAIKVLFPEVAAQAVVSEDMMVREARILVRLRRRTQHVVDVLRVGVTPDAMRLPYYVMECLDGVSLRTAIGRRAEHKRMFSFEDILRILIQVCVTMGHAHATDLIHCDLKPENLFLHREGGTITVLDFGLGILAGSIAHRFIGTLRYSAREQRERRPLTRATDVFALGVVAFELVTLRTPWEPTRPLSRDELLVAMLSPAPDVRYLRPETPAVLATLIAECLRDEPNERLNNVMELANRLEGILMPLVSQVKQEAARMEQLATRSALEAERSIPILEMPSVAPPTMNSELFTGAPEPNVTAPMPSGRGNTLRMPTAGAVSTRGNTLRMPNAPPRVAAESVPPASSFVATYPTPRAEVERAPSSSSFVASYPTMDPTLEQRAAEALNHTAYPIGGRDGGSITVGDEDVQINSSWMAEHVRPEPIEPQHAAPLLPSSMAPQLLSRTPHRPQNDGHSSWLLIASLLVGAGAMGGLGAFGFMRVIGPTSNDGQASVRAAQPLAAASSARSASSASPTVNIPSHGPPASAPSASVYRALAPSMPSASITSAPRPPSLPVTAASTLKASASPPASIPPRSEAPKVTEPVRPAAPKAYDKIDRDYRL
jgi:serine/threonine protein kinase